MTSRIFMIIGTITLLILGGCVNRPSTEDVTAYGGCEYSTRVKNKEVFAVNYYCNNGILRDKDGKSIKDKKGKEEKPRISMHCSSEGDWSIVLGAGYYKHVSPLAVVEYSFDDNPYKKVSWGRFILWPYAYHKENEPNREFINSMKTAKKLTYTLDEKTVSIDLAGSGMGAEVFEGKCNLVAKKAA